MSKAESGNGEFMEPPKPPKAFKWFYAWGGDSCGLVRIERVDEGMLTVKDARNIAYAILEAADEEEKQTRAAEAHARIEAFREALREGRAWEALDSLERKGLRRAGRGQSLSRTQAMYLREKGLISVDGRQLTEDGKRALQQLAPTTAEPLNTAWAQQKPVSRKEHSHE